MTNEEILGGVVSAGSPAPEVKAETPQWLRAWEAQRSAAECHESRIAAAGSDPLGLEEWRRRMRSVGRA